MSPVSARTLIEAYGGLSDVEKYALEFAAVCDEQPTKEELIRDLAGVLPRLMDAGPNRQKSVAPIYKKLRDTGFFEVGYKGVSVSAAVYESAVRDAICSGRGEVYRRWALERDRQKPRWFEYGTRKKRLFHRRYREALYTGSEMGAAEAYAQLAADVDETRDGLALPLAQMLSYSDAFDFLETGSVFTLSAHLPDALAETQFFHSLTASVVAPLCRFIERVPSLKDETLADSFQQLLLLLVGECRICGEMDGIEPILSRMHGYHKDAASGVVAFSSGDMVEAARLFETSLVKMRKATRRKRLFFNNVIGEIFIYTCLRQNTPESLFRAGELLEDAVRPTNNSLYREVFKKLAWLVEARRNPEPVPLWEYKLPWKGRYARLSEVMADVLAKTLYRRDSVREFEGLAEYLTTCVRDFQNSPRRQVLADWQAMLAHILDGASDDTRLPAPTFDFSAGDADWKLVLYNISRIGKKGAPPKAKNGTPQPASKRMSFRIALEEWSDSWQVTPFVQKQNSNGGWSRGKAFNVKKMQSGGEDTAFLTEQDERVLMRLVAEKNLRDSRNRYGWYDMNCNDVLFELVGHPYLFWDTPALIPLEIEAGTPQVEVLAAGDHVEIRMRPGDPCDKGFCVEERNANLLRVTRFTPMQLELLAALGAKGARIPQNAEADIAEALSHIGAIAEVHSHVPNIGRTSVEVPPDETLVVRMQPFVDGLSAQFLILPLGERGPSFVPGRGSVHVFATVGKEKRTTTRRLKEEEKRLDALLDELGLRYADEDGEGLYHFSEELQAVEFLNELADYKQRESALPLSLEWPRGAKLSCTRTLFPKDFRLHIQRQRKWLALGGDLRISNDALVKMAVLVAGLDSKHPGYIKLKDGQFLRLSKSLRQFLLRLSGTGELLDDGTIKAPVTAALSIRKLSDEAGTVEANAAWEKTVADLDKSLSVVSKVPARVKATLRDYQREGYGWLHRLSALGLGACLADDMGLGKTLQALALMCYRLERRGNKKPALVVAPVSVIPGWFEEARRFVPSLNLVHYEGAHRKKILDNIAPRQVLVTSYGLLQRDGAALAKISFDMIVLDEAQFIKNKDSARAEAAFKLQGDFKMVTTGTPVENRLSEFWSLFHFINPGLLGTHKLFIDVFEKNIQLFEDPHVLESLRWQVRPFLLRRTKEETLDELPPKTEIVRYCEMAKDEAAFYELKRKQAVDNLKTADSRQQMMELITSLTTLRQAACHPRLIEPTLDVESAKLNTLKEILIELKEGGHQALIFSQFVKFLTIVKQWLDGQGISYQYMDGSQSSAGRTAAVEAFQSGESDLFLISTRSGGFGLNLTAADYVVHLDPWWNPAVEDQASDRVHRIGQSRPVTVYKLVTKGTVEEKVLQIHGDKRALAGGLLEGSSGVAKLNMKELLALI